MDNELFDKEEMERLEKAITRCRTCDHVMIAHTYLGKPKGRCLDARLTNKEKHERCTCQQFKPKDNLEYLEWVAKQKEKGK